MTAKLKQGIDYFPLHVDFLSNNKIRKLVKKHGHAFIAVSVSLLNTIYKFEGYYADYDEDLIFAIADSLYMEEEEVEGISTSMTPIALHHVHIPSTKTNIV